MSQQFQKNPSERISCNGYHHDSSSSPGADHDGDHQDIAYASHQSLTNKYAVSFHQPIIDHNDALLPLQATQTNEIRGPAQEVYEAGPQYSYQINTWHGTVFNDYQLEGLTPDAGFYDASLNFSYNGIDTELTFPTSPVWGFNNTQDFMQPNMIFMDGAQPIPPSYPTVVSAPPALVAPVAAPANRIRCPQGCRATFGRGGDYRRHMKSHQRPRYRCPMVGCRMTFSRADKLRDHAKKGHGGVNPLRLF